ncbi:alpha-ketoacid dehydrogenase subunit beta [Radicibacter daui]|uniref:alpha-ketoacid dehydrogenase subunit beta n=1 Tax=Radicibacter daui TaxID=3064829 RepID=UPI004046BBDF
MSMLSEKPAMAGRLLAYVDALSEGVAQEMERDPSVFLFGLDVDDHKAIQGSTRGLVQRFGPNRVFGTPLSEDAMTGVAIGAAMAGMRPIHVHIRMDFLMLCMNQLVNIAAKAHYMFGGAVSVPMVVRCMIGKSWGQGAQHSQGLHSLFMHIPGLKVVAPSNAYDAKGLMAAAIRDNNPVVFVEHRLLYFTDAYVPEESYTVELGKARVTAPGTDITLVGVSNMVMECLRARELLAQVGISAEVVDLVSLQPLDSDTVLASASKTGKLLMVDNAWTMCGASAEVLARVAESEEGAGVRMARMGFAPTTCPMSPELEKVFYPNAATIAAKAHSMLRPGSDWMPDEKAAQLSYQMTFRGPF